MELWNFSFNSLATGSLCDPICIMEVPDILNLVLADMLMVEPQKRARSGKLQARLKSVLHRQSWKYAVVDFEQS